MPNHENFEGITQIQERIVEKHIAKATADEDADNCPSENVAPNFFGEREISIALQSRKKKISEDKTCEVEETVPVHIEAKNRQGDRS
jgi:hypothetical protein